jgi:hypothetical protein
MKNEQNHYIVVSKRGNIDYTSISVTRKGAIANFIGDCNMQWKECRLYGWRVVKCKIIIKS